MTTTPFKALLLDERDVFVELVTITYEAQLTARHVDLRPYGGDCDRPVGQYRWDRTKDQLVPLPRQQRAERGRPTLEQATAFELLRKWGGDRANSAVLTEVAFAWLDDMVRSVDFGPFLKVQVVADYIAARGLVVNQRGV